MLTFLLAPKEILASVWKIVWEPERSYCNSRLWQAAMSARSKTSCGVSALKIPYSTGLMRMCVCVCVYVHCYKVFTVLISCTLCKHSSVCCSYAQCASGQNVCAFLYFGFQHSLAIGYIYVGVYVYVYLCVECSVKHLVGIWEAELSLYKNISAHILDMECIFLSELILRL